jgi:uncharacterized OB-fold protein
MGLLRPLPETDTDAAAFWQAATEGKLLIQHCRRCGGYQHYARPFCITCRDADVEMVEAGGAGVLHSFTVVYRSPYDDVPTPYVVGLVRLDEGVTLLTNVVGCDPARVACDMPVEVTYQTVRDGVVIPVFRPRKAG